MHTFHWLRRRLLLFRKRVRLLLLLLIEILLGVAMSLLSFVLFYKLTEGVLYHQVNFFDLTISHFIQSFRTPWLTVVMYFLTFLGGDVIVIGTVLISSVFLWKKQRSQALFFLFTVMMGFAMNLTVKQLVARPRPANPLYHEMFYSFPSAHAMTSFIFYAVLVFGIFHYTRKKRLSLIMGLVMIVLVGFIGISRIYLGVHYPSDVLGGFVAGFWWVVTVLLIEKTYFFIQELEKK